MNEDGSDAADKEEDVRSAQGGFLPPVMDNKLGGLRARRAPRKDWQDPGPIQKSKLQSYMVAEDKFASNYLAGLKR